MLNSFSEIKVGSLVQFRGCRMRRAGELQHRCQHCCGTVLAFGILKNFENLGNLPRVKLQSGDESYARRPGSLRLDVVGVREKRKADAIQKKIDAKAARRAPKPSQQGDVLGYPA